MIRGTIFKKINVLFIVHFCLDKYSFCFDIFWSHHNLKHFKSLSLILTSIFLDLWLLFNHTHTGHYLYDNKEQFISETTIKDKLPVKLKVRSTFTSGKPGFLYYLNLLLCYKSNAIAVIEISIIIKLSNILITGLLVPCLLLFLHTSSVNSIF